MMFSHRIHFSTFQNITILFLYTSYWLHQLENDTKTMNSAPRDCHVPHRNWNTLNHQVNSLRICQLDLHLDWFSNNPNQLISNLEFSFMSNYNSQYMHSKYSSKMQLHMISSNLSISGLTYKILKSNKLNRIIIIIIIKVNTNNNNSNNNSDNDDNNKKIVVIIMIIIIIIIVLIR